MGTRTSPCSAFERSPVDRRGCGESPMAGLTPTIARQPIRDQKADYAGSLLQALFSLGDRRHAWPAIRGGILSVCHGWAQHQTTKRPLLAGHGHVAPSPPLLKPENPSAGKFKWFRRLTPRKLNPFIVNVVHDKRG